MNSFTNTPPFPIPVSHNFFFGSPPRIAHNVKDSMSPGPRIQKENSLVYFKKTEPIENRNKEVRAVDQSLLESMQENQFMVGFKEMQKNVNPPTFSPFTLPSTELHQLHDLDKAEHHDFNKAKWQKSELQNENEMSFLLDSATYKEICLEQNTRKIGQPSDLHIESLHSFDDICLIHDKPFEIVCIKDKTLVCSHCAIFGDHKNHPLAPFKEIQKAIEVKREKINQIITGYKVKLQINKALQLSIKEKSFCCQIIDQISMKKTEMRLTAEQQFRKIRQVLSCYENQIYKELDQFYSALETKLNDCIKQSSLESCSTVFQKWEKDVTALFEQMSLNSTSNKGKVNLFLSNFNVAQPAQNSKPKQQKRPLSFQIEGENCFTQIKQQLNLNVASLAKTVEMFNLRLDDKFETKLKSLIKFQCDTRYAGLLEQHDLNLMQSSLLKFKSKESPKESLKFITPLTSQSINFKCQEKQLASTVVSLAQSTTALQGGLKSSRNSHLNSPVKKPESKNKNLQQLNLGTVKKPLKYKRYETQEDAKKFEEEIRLSQNPSNILDARSDCGQKKRRVSTCLVKEMMAGFEGEKMCTSTAVSRIKRYKSKEVTVHKRSPSDECKREGNETNRKRLVTCQNEVHPLQTLENFENTETETLDLSGCGLNDTEVLYFVEKASKIRKTKHLKLSSNLLTSQGFEKILPFLPFCNLINLSNNKLSESTLDCLLRKKDKVPQLKMVNLSNNKLNERIIKEKIAEFKKMNVVVTL